MSRRRSCLGCLTRLFLLLAVVIVAACAGIYLLLNQPYQAFSQPVVLEFPKGTSTAAMGSQLAQAGVLRHGWEFLAVRVIRPGARLQAGEYQFARAASAFTVFDRIVRGDVFYYEVTVPEGSNMFDIAAAVNALGFLHGQDFLKVARDPAMIADLDPKAPTLEGYLFPSTYRVTRHATVQHLCRMMTDLFRKRWSEVQKEGHPANVHDTVTLASMIEKETAVSDERPVVASVYTNRLQRGMTLDCDPTTIYAALLEQRYRGVIHRSDLESLNEYNTYKHAGLPPGPIANPGEASLKAALAPATTDYIFFVAKPDGSGAHQFSTSMAEHNRAVQEYRQRHAR